MAVGEAFCFTNVTHFYGEHASGMNLHESELTIMMRSHSSENRPVLGIKHCASKCKPFLYLPFRRNANEGSTFHDMLEDVFFALRIRRIYYIKPKRRNISMMKLSKKKRVSLF